MASTTSASRRLQQIQGTLRGSDTPLDPEMNWPKLPVRAAYLTLNNARRRNALSLTVLRDLRDQLHSFNTSPKDGKLRLLPPFKPEILKALELAHVGQDAEAAQEYGWLLEASEWQAHREGLPNVLVLRSDGPVFCSGHDLGELRQLPHNEVKETFALCAEVMSMIKRSPAPVIGFIQGLATAAGCQLALTTDLPIACSNTQFRLPGASLGLPCTSPSTAVARKLGNAFTYRMLALAEPITADQLPNGAVETVSDPTTLESRVAAMVEQLASNTAGQPQALGKWAYWTQVGMNGREGGGDGYEDAVSWTGRVMALHARAADAREGMNAFFEKRPPSWKT
jgi:enoyl-CoA hydratase/carnithine racemase